MFKGQKMTTEHKLAWALRAAADDENARFTYWGNENIFDIFSVLSSPNQDWKLIKLPVVTHEYYISSNNDFYNCSQSCKWNMHITLIDGVPHKEVEFR